MLKLVFADHRQMSIDYIFAKTTDHYHYLLYKPFSTQVLCNDNKLLQVLQKVMGLEYLVMVDYKSLHDIRLNTSKFTIHLATHHMGNSKCLSHGMKWILGQIAVAKV